MKEMKFASIALAGRMMGVIVALIFVLLSSGGNSTALAQIATASVQKTCPIGCQPIQLVRASSFRRGDDAIEIQVTWELAALPAGMQASGFEVIAKAQASNGREREDRIRVGGSERRATILLNNFAFRNLKTFRARVVGTFSVNQISREFTVTSKTLVQSGRDVFLDVKWDTTGFNPNPCLISGFKIVGEAVTDRGRKITGVDFVADPKARFHRLKLDQGRDGINPTFVSSGATVSTNDVGSFGIECGVSSGETTVGDDIANTTLSRTEITKILERETKLISAMANGAQVKAAFQLSNSSIAPLRNGNLSVSPVFKNGAVGGQSESQFASVNASQQAITVNFSASQLAGKEASGPLVGFDVILSASYLPPDGKLIEFDRRLRISAGLVASPTVAAGGTVKTPSATTRPSTSGAQPQASVSSPPKASSGSSGATAAQPGPPSSKGSAASAASKQSPDSASREQKAQPKAQGRAKQ